MLLMLDQVARSVEWNWTLCCIISTSVLESQQSLGNGELELNNAQAFKYEVLGLVK
jgi:hypothetical protein